LKFSVKNLEVTGDLF